VFLAANGCQLVERLKAFHASTPDAVELIEITGVINNLVWL
jgi:hypothetical protein